MVYAVTFLLASAPSMAVRSRLNPWARTFMPEAKSACSCSSVAGGESREARTAISCCWAASCPSLSMSSLRESLAGLYMMDETCLPSAVESLMSVVTPWK